MNHDQLAAYLTSIGFGGKGWKPSTYVKHGPLFVRNTSDQTAGEVADLTVTTNMLEGPIKALVTKEDETLLAVKGVMVLLSAADGQIITTPELEEARCSFALRYNEDGETGDVDIPISPMAIGTGYDQIETTQATAADGEAAVAAPRGWHVFPDELWVDMKNDDFALRILNAIGSGTINVTLVLDAYAVRKEDLRKASSKDGCDKPGGAIAQGGGTPQRRFLRLG